MMKILAFSVTVAIVRVSRNGYSCHRCLGNRQSGLGIYHDSNGCDGRSNETKSHARLHLGENKIAKYRYPFCSKTSLRTELILGVYKVLYHERGTWTDSTVCILLLIRCLKR